MADSLEKLKKWVLYILLVMIIYEEEWKGETWKQMVWR